MTATLPPAAKRQVRLRPYQQQVIESIFSGWDGGLLRPAISMATGAGKSVVFAEVARRHLEHHRATGPVCLLAHRKELIYQAAGHFQRAAPDLRVETVIGSPGPPGSTRRHKAVMAWKRADVLVASVQTLRSEQTMYAFPDPSLVIADEAHHSSAQSWTTVLTALGCFNRTRALGVTATPFREDHREFSDVWQAIVASIDIAWLITHGLVDGDEVEVAPGSGYLIPPTLRHLLVDGLDLSQVPTSQKSGAVDFREGELADEMHRAGAFDLVAKTVVAELADRKGVLFAPTVESSRYLASVLSAAGAPCHHVDGTMAQSERDRVIGDFRDGTVRWLSNVNIVSEGFDLPEIDAVVLARPTQSRIFFRQSIGRALRPSPGKTDAVILDVAGVSDGHSLAGVEALTDTDVLTAANGEGLTELLDRSARERHGRFDRITAHLDEARDIQRRAERTAEQITLTAEGLAEQLPGIKAFSARVPERLAEVQDFAVGAQDQAMAANPEQTLDALGSLERTCAEEVAAARASLARLEQLKPLMRSALLALRDEPTGQVARAMTTGSVATVQGHLFGEEEQRTRPGAPSSVQRLKVRGANRDERPTHPARYGWAMRADSGAYFCLVHGESRSPADQAGPQPTRTRSEPTAFTVAVPVGDPARWMPVWWDRDTGEAKELAEGFWDEESAYRLVVQAAADETTADNLLNPAAAWRRKPSPTGNGARALARRVAPGIEIPDNATAGFVSDCITFGKYAAEVDKFVAWVRTQTTVST